MKWIQEYRCGCSVTKKNKRDLLGYCADHGDEAIATYREDKAWEHFQNRLKEAGQKPEETK